MQQERRSGHGACRSPEVRACVMSSQHACYFLLPSHRCCCLRQVKLGTAFTSHISHAQHMHVPPRQRQHVHDHRCQYPAQPNATQLASISRYICAPSSSLFRAEVDRQLRRRYVRASIMKAVAAMLLLLLALMHHARRSPPKQCVSHTVMCASI